MIKSWDPGELSRRIISYLTRLLAWASYQNRKTTDCACAGIAGNVFPATAGLRSRHASRAHVPWCMLRSLTSGFLWSQWRGKRSRSSRCMRNPQFYVSGKRSMVSVQSYRSSGGEVIQEDMDAIYQTTTKVKQVCVFRISVTCACIFDTIEIPIQYLSNRDLYSNAIGKHELYSSWAILHSLM